MNKCDFCSARAAKYSKHRRYFESKENDDQLSVAGIEKNAVIRSFGSMAAPAYQEEVWVWLMEREAPPWHIELTQACPLAQTTPHAPQFIASVCKFLPRGSDTSDHRVHSGGSLCRAWNDHILLGADARGDRDRRRRRRAAGVPCVPKLPVPEVLQGDAGAGQRTREPADGRCVLLGHLPGLLYRDVAKMGGLYCLFNNCSTECNEVASAACGEVCG